jgi:hypothetical protein
MDTFLRLNVAAWEFENIAKTGHRACDHRAGGLRNDSADKSLLLVVVERSLCAAAKAD